MLTSGSYKFINAVVFLSSLFFQATGTSQNMLPSSGPNVVHGESAGAELAKPGSNTNSNQSYEDNARVSMELSTLGERGNLIAHVREQTLQILQSDNTCSAWFQESDPDVADVFRSLHYDVDASGTADIDSIRDKFGDLLFRHPWGARSREYAGRNSFIQINGNGPFFVRRSRVTSSDPREAAVLPAGLIPVLIGPYTGATPEAQITIMLHELVHIIGRLPKDDNSWDGSSSRNTSEVLRHCKREIHQMARKTPGGFNNGQLQANSSHAPDHQQAGVND